jgi:hypothetical protein
MSDDGVFQHIARFEDGMGRESQAWLGRGPGLALGVGLVFVAAAATPLLWIAGFASDSRLLIKLCGLVWLTIIGGVTAYWRRQRLAAHFESAHRRLGSADPNERQQALTDMMLNSRRGRAEHGRIARALTTYLRRPPHEQADERGRRQLAFAMLADQTLTTLAKRQLDLTGAMLAGIRGVSAELPGVCLRGADLTNAVLARANLEGADLREARLDGANLSGARLQGALQDPVR